MEKQHLNNAKKLNKKELKTIHGGVKLCAGNVGCLQVHPSCYEPQCRGTDPIKCENVYGYCGTIAPNCIESQCRPNIEIPV